MAKEAKYKLQGDAPLRDPKDDLLGHAKFAKDLAESIIGLKPPEDRSFVYGLYGKWGAGKSTVLNFAEHYINKSNQKNGKSKIVVFKFNPWMFSGSENLTRVYFEQLHVRLNKEGKFWKRVSQKIAQLSMVAAPVVGEILIPSSGVLITGVAKNGSPADRQEKSDQDLHHAKESIADALRNQDDKILVIIDDLDRLFKKEIRQIIRVIKAVCDFPNIIYLIACDSEKVASALSDKKEEVDDGYDYLEKIVQLSYNLPNPDWARLYNLFFENLDSIFGHGNHYDDKDLIQLSSWMSNDFRMGFGQCLKNFRNVKALINSIVACYPLVRGEAHIKDFVEVQALRVFYQQAYQWVGNNKNLFTGSADPLLGGDEQKQRERKMKLYEPLHQLFSENETGKRDVCQALIKRLFPEYKKAFRSHVGSDVQKWNSEHRICSPEWFDLYFRLSIPEGAFGFKEIRDIVALADRPTELKDKLSSLIKEGRHRKFLQELKTHPEEEIPTPKIQPLLQAILDSSSEELEKVPTDGKHDPISEWNGILGNVQLVLNRFIERLDSEEERFHLLKTIFGNSESISIVVMLAYHVLSAEDNEDNIVTPSHAREIESLLLDRIRESANNNCLPHTPFFISILHHPWQKWGTEREVREYVAKLTTSDKGILLFLIGHRGSGDRLESIEKLMGGKHMLEKLVGKARIILAENDQLTQFEREVLQALIDQKDNSENYRRYHN